MIHKKYTRYEKKEIKQQQVAQAMSGEGMYLFRNPSPHADLTLPRPTKSGLRSVGPLQEFQGDSYYMQMVKTGLLRFVKELQSPAQERAAAALNEANMTQQQEKLILDQPDMITEQGKVEHVVNKNTPIQKMNEHGKQQPQKQPDILLNEGEEAFVFVQ